MGFWFWFWISVAVIIVGMFVQVLIALRLAVKAKQLQRPAEKLQTMTTELSVQAAKLPKLRKVEPSIDADPVALANRLAKVRKAKAERKQARQRRLVERLRAKTNESESRNA